MKTEAEIGVRQLQAKEPQQPPKARREAWNSVNTLISNFGFQNCERINFYCFKPPSLRTFVMAVIENLYRW